MPRLSAKQQGIKLRFIRLWHAKYGKSPTADVVGVMLSLVLGELTLGTVEASTWPTAGIVALLRQAVEEGATE